MASRHSSASERCKATRSWLNGARASRSIAARCSCSSDRASSARVASAVVMSTACRVPARAAIPSVGAADMRGRQTVLWTCVPRERGRQTVPSTLGAPWEQAGRMLHAVVRAHPRGEVFEIESDFQKRKQRVKESRILRHAASIVTTPLELHPHGSKPLARITRLVLEQDGMRVLPRSVRQLRRGHEVIPYPCAPAPPRLACSGTVLHCRGVDLRARHDQYPEATRVSRR